MDNEIISTQDLEEELLEEEAPVEIDPPKFVVKTTLNGKLQMEAAVSVRPKWANALGYVCYGLCTLFAAYMIYMFFALNKNGTYLVLAGLSLLMMVYLFYSNKKGPAKQIARWEANLRRQFGTDAMHMTTEFYENILVQHLDETNSDADEGYSRLWKMCETEHLLLLQCGKNQWFFLEKAGVEGGKVEELKDFLAQRVPFPGGN